MYSICLHEQLMSPLIVLFHSFQNIHLKIPQATSAHIRACWKEEKTKKKISCPVLEQNSFKRWKSNFSICILFHHVL